jgi:hypothetical protein
MNTGSFGLFGSAPSSPHAFSTFGQSPRGQHDMYAQFGAAVTGQGSQSKSGSGFGSLKKLVGRK